MTTRRRITEEIDEPEAVDAPMAAVAVEEAGRTADHVSDALAGLDEFAEPGASFKVYKLPGYQYCREIDPRDDTTAMLEDVREEYGPGNYVVRVYVKGRKGQIAERAFSIAAARRREEVKKDESFTEKLLLAMVSGGGMNKGPDLAALMAAQQQSADRQTTAMMGMISAIVPALAGNKGESAASLLTAMAPLLERPKAPGFGDAIEALLQAKELFSRDGGGDEGGGVMEAAVKAIGPSIPDFARGFADMAARGRQDAAQPMQMVPAARPAIVAPNHAAGAGAGLMARFPLLAAIAPDVMFYFGRRIPPELAADGVFEVLNQMKVGEAELVPLIAAFQTSENWIADLAAGGLDLSSNPQWAHEFLNNLIAIYSGEDDDSERGGGSPGDTESHGETGAVGEPSNGRPQPGRRADKEA